MNELKCRCGSEDLTEGSCQNNLSGHSPQFQRINFICRDCGEDVYADRKGFAEDRNPICYAGCSRLMPLEKQLNLFKIGKPGINHPGPDALRKEYDNYILAL